MSLTRKRFTIWERALREVTLKGNILPYLLFTIGLILIGLEVYKTINAVKSQFDVFTLTPIFGAILVILASIAIRNSDNKRKRNIALLRGEILNRLRKESFLSFSDLFNSLSSTPSMSMFRLALEELKSENLIHEDDKQVFQIVDNTNLDQYKYGLALTINELNRKISFGKELEHKVKTFISNPLRYSISEANGILLEIRSFLSKEE